jgi:hypothetical protein
MVQQDIVLVDPPGRLYSGPNNRFNLGLGSILVSIEGVVRAFSARFTPLYSRLLNLLDSCWQLGGILDILMGKLLGQHLACSLIDGQVNLASGTPSQVRCLPTPCWPTFHSPSP